MKINDIDDGMFHFQYPRSFNNRLILEIYKKSELRSKISNGFASIDQKTTLKGLKVLVETKLNDGTLIRKNSLAYIKEELLHTQVWAQKPLECEAIGQSFIIVDISFVDFISPPEPEKERPF